MNEFIEQFLLESREHVEQATAALLALEATPDDKVHLDSVFRSFHTLKGGSGIVEFVAMADAVHAAEDALSTARSGGRAITAQLIGDCLSCLDQVVLWLRAMENSGEIPKHAEAEAASIVARFARLATEGEELAQSKRKAVAGDWVEDLLKQHPELRISAKTGVRYVPAPSCFFEGEDPFARVAALPGLLTIGVAPVAPWPAADSLDPFICNLVITALTQSSRADLSGAMVDAIGECDLQDVSNGQTLDETLAVAPRVREVLEAQLALIKENTPQGTKGRLASAGVVAANVLRHSGRVTDAEHMARSTETSLANNDPRYLRDAIERVLNGKPSPVLPLSSPAAEPASTTRTLRVEASRVDALVNLTGELVTVKNSLSHVAKLVEQGDPAALGMLRHRHAALERLIGELQGSVLAMRVLPLRHVFQRFPRLLREMSIALGKPMNLVLEGGETEADKVIVEMLFEPLLHVLRNAIDHGIENPSTRAGLRKPSVATIRLRAQRLGERVLVEVSDDGGGIDVSRIREVALAQGVAADSIASMSEAAAIDMIFQPGFSTATEVTGVSGRGVGMDVVRTAVRRVGGDVSIESHTGQGTTVRFMMPFTVMMTHIMVVTAGGQAFGVALDSVVETVRVNADRIVPIGAGQAMVLRKQTLPVVSLAAALGLPREDRQAQHATIVVTRVNGQYGALWVDRIGERMEIMLKPLDGLLAGTRGVGGSTLLGDGAVLLVLDIEEFFQ